MALDSADVFRRCEQRAPAAALLAYANDRRRPQSFLRTVLHVPFVVNVLHIVGLVGRSLAKRGSFCTEERALRTQDPPLLYGSPRNMKHGLGPRVQTIWQLMLRIVVGTYWIYFSVMKWFDRSWVNDLVSTAVNGSYIPGYSQLLKFVSNYTGSLAIAITVVEAIIGAFILLGVSTRVGAAIGAFLGLNLMLTFAFCRCSWTQEDFPLVFWFYFFPIVLNLELIFDNSSSSFGIRKVLRKIRHSRKSE